MDAEEKRKLILAIGDELNPIMRKVWLQRPNEYEIPLELMKKYYMKVYQEWVDSKEARDKAEKARLKRLGELLKRLK